MNINIFKFPFLYKELKKLKANNQVWNELKIIRTDYPSIWEFIRKLGSDFHNIKYQHNLIRQIIIFLRDSKKTALLSKINLKAEVILQKHKTKAILLDDLFFELKEAHLTNDELIIDNNKLGGRAVSHQVTNIFHGKPLKDFIIREFTNSKVFEIFDNTRYETIIKKWSDSKIKEKLTATFKNEEVNIRCGCKYFWSTKENILSNQKNTNFEDIYYSLGFERDENHKKDHLIIFKLPIQDNEISKSTIFASGTGFFYRPQLGRNGNWGETVNSLSLKSGIPEGLVDQMKASTDFVFGNLKNLETMPLGLLKKGEVEVDFLLESFNDFRLNW